MDQNETFIDSVSIGNNIHKYVMDFEVMAVETQKELICKTVNSFAEGEVHSITIDKQKTIEALTDYLKKYEQLPRINKYPILKKAINTYGEQSQVDMAIEEMSELIKALLKNRRALKSPAQWDYEATKNNIIEEIADVAIMLKQLLMIYDINNEVQEQVDFKINRLDERLAQKERR